VQAKEQLVGGTPRVEERREQFAAEQVEAGSAQEIALEGQLMRQRRQQSLTVAFQSPQQTAQTTAADLNAQVGSRDVFQVMSLVEDQAAIRRQNRGLGPVVLHLPNREVGGEQMVIDHNHVRLCCHASSAKQETGFEVRALETGARGRLRR
jgi:hypothetical protein